MHKCDQCGPNCGRGLLENLDVVVQITVVDSLLKPWLLAIICKLWGVNGQLFSWVCSFPSLMSLKDLWLFVIVIDQMLSSRVYFLFTLSTN